jgi:hypothetical protein
MEDILTEELAAIRRIRLERLKELMRDLEEGRELGSGSEANTRESGVHEPVASEGAPARSSAAPL